MLGGYNINDPNLGFQPRAYGAGYTLPEKVLSYTASIQQELPGNAVLTVAYVGSQGRNLFLRSWTNGIVGVTMNPTTGAGNAVLQFGPRFAQIDYKTSGGTDHYDSLQTTLEPAVQQGPDGGPAMDLRRTASATRADPTKRRPRRILSTSSRIAGTMLSTCAIA